jgi:hypothetical protein
VANDDSQNEIIEQTPDGVAILVRRENNGAINETPNVFNGAGANRYQALEIEMPMSPTDNRYHMNSRDFEEVDH